MKKVSIKKEVGGGAVAINRELVCVFYALRSGFTSRKPLNRVYMYVHVRVPTLQRSTVLYKMEGYR